MTAKDDPTNTAIGTQHPAARPILRCLPDLVRGIPICRDIFPFIAEMPSARLQENEKPYFLPIALSFLLHRTSGLTGRRTLCDVRCSPLFASVFIVAELP